MNITTDKAEGLAQRALELANEIEPVRDYKIKKLTLRNPAASQIVEILRHYAEIAPKWQAVLDAEPVKTTCFGTQLIIKPAP